MAVVNPGVGENFGVYVPQENPKQSNGWNDFWTGFGNLITGATDYSRNMEMAAYEHEMNREDMAIQNAFTAEREDLAWQRSQQQAQESREWDKLMADTAIQRQVKDLKAAGLNPWLAAGGSGASLSSAPSPSASSASSAGISALKLPESKIWANTSSSIKTALSSLISLAVIGKSFGWIK